MKTTTLDSKNFVDAYHLSLAIRCLLDTAKAHGHGVGSVNMHPGRVDLIESVLTDGSTVADIRITYDE